ncbi:FG-GAP-like repeat-containing protein, partial [Streptomyces sp. NPDC001889]
TPRTPLPYGIAVRCLLAFALAIVSTITVQAKPASAAPETPREVVREYSRVVTAIRRAAQRSEETVDGQAGGSVATSSTAAARGQVPNPQMRRTGIRLFSLDRLRSDQSPATSSVSLVVQMSDLYVQGFYQLSPSGAGTFFRFQDDFPPTQELVDHQRVFGRQVTEHRLPFRSAYAAMAGENVWNQSIAPEGLVRSVQALTETHVSVDSQRIAGQSLARVIATVVEGARNEWVAARVRAAFLRTDMPAGLSLTSVREVIQDWRVITEHATAGQDYHRFVTGGVALAFTAYRLRNMLQIPWYPKPNRDHWIGKVPRLAVMPLGDSITLGVGSGTRTGYRPEIAQHLAGAADRLEFVGSMTDPDGTRHEGHSGWRIDQIQANIETWLAAAKPNVVLLHIGTNDMNRDHQTSSAPQRLSRLLAQIHAASPDTAVVLASLVPATDPAVQARVDAYNRQIPGIVAARADQGQRVVQVSMDALTHADLNDNLHPNNAGYTKMAAAFTGGVRSLIERNWVKETVVVNPAPPKAAGALGDYDVDINGDGRADYLVVEDNGATRAWLSSGDATGKVLWTDQGVIATGSTQWTADQVRFADINGDQRADYLVMEPNGATRALLNTADASGKVKWSDQGVIATGSSYWTADQIRFADINGDQRADYLVMERNGATRAYVNTADATGKVTWTNSGHIATGSSQWTADQVRFADINGDQRADYLVMEPNGATRALLNTADASGKVKWSDQGVIATGSTRWTADQVRFSDINADGRADYLIVDAQGAIHAYLNTADATGKVKLTDQGVIATGTGSPGSRVRI